MKISKPQFVLMDFSRPSLCTVHGKVGDIANAYMLSFLLQQQAWELLDRRNVTLAWTNGVTAGRSLLRIVFPTLPHHWEYVLKCSCGGVRRSMALTWTVG